MYKFTYNEVTNCLMLKKGNELIDHEFFNEIHLQNMVVKEFLQMLHDNMKVIAERNNINEYIYNFLE